MHEHEAKLRSAFFYCIVVAVYLFTFAVITAPSADQSALSLLDPTPHGTVVPDGFSAPPGVVMSTGNGAISNPHFDEAMATERSRMGVSDPEVVTSSPQINRGDPLTNCPATPFGDTTLASLSVTFTDYRCSQLATPGYQRGMAECVVASQDLSHPDYGKECF